MNECKIKYSDLPTYSMYNMESSGDLFSNDEIDELFDNHDKSHRWYIDLLQVDTDIMCDALINMRADETFYALAE